MDQMDITSDLLHATNFDWFLFQRIKKNIIKFLEDEVEQGSPTFSLQGPQLKRTEKNCYVHLVRIIIYQWNLKCCIESQKM